VSRSGNQIAPVILRCVAVASLAPAALSLNLSFESFQLGGSRFVVYFLGSFAALFVAFGAWLIFRPRSHPASFLATWALFTTWYSFRTAPLRPQPSDYALLTFAVIAAGAWLFSVVSQKWSENSAA
jgi:hypothetical protein